MNSLTEGIVTEEDIAAGQKKLSELLSSPDAAKDLFKYISEIEPQFMNWLDKSVGELATTLFQNLSRIESPLELMNILIQNKLESFFIVYCAFTRFWADTLSFDPKGKLELSLADEYDRWKRGLMPEEYYNFEPRNEDMRTAKENYMKRQKLMKQLSEYKTFKTKVREQKEQEREKLEEEPV